MNLLLAAKNALADDDELFGLPLGIWTAIVIISVFIQVLFLLSISRCFQEISPRNRRMSPGEVWLNLVPVFNIVWLIITVLRLGDSLADEYHDRRLRPVEDFGRTNGIIYVVSQFVCPIVTLIFLIIYWSGVVEFTRTLRRYRPIRDDDDGANDIDDHDRRNRDGHDDRRRRRLRSLDFDDDFDDRRRRDDF